MLAEQEDVFYYITLMNENYAHPEMPEGAEADISKGMYRFSVEEKTAAKKNAPHVQLLGSGAIFREAIAAAELLRDDWGVAATLWSCPSFTELEREGRKIERDHLLHPEAVRKTPHVEKCLQNTRGPVIAVSDYNRAFAEQIRPYLPVGRRYVTLGTDGFGRSDTREKLRHFFEVDRRWITVAALKALADDGTIPAARVAEALKKYALDAEKPPPWTV
jgi:pyruvate dehydrogenase E1 component